MKIAISAAETSGDLIAASLVKSLKEHQPEYEIEGLAGDKMIEAGCKSLWHSDEVNVMGLSEVIKKLPQVLRLRKSMISHYSSNRPDIFIGVDSPDFNMFFHKRLKDLGIKTVQVVSPSVWGWRENRIKAISSFIDLTMCLFQFEHDYYQAKNMNSFFLGHPFSELKPTASNDVLEKYKLNGSLDFTCILPGSRKSEILHMMPIFIQAAERIYDLNPNAFFLIPAANNELKALIQSTLEKTSFNYQLTSSAAKDYLSISKISIVTSGTASLEAAVLGSLPIICYKTNTFNYAILSRMLKTPFIGLPNLLLQQHVFPELVQYELNPEAIAHHYENLSLDPHKYQSQIEEMNTAMQGKGFEEAAHLLLSF